MSDSNKLHSRNLVVGTAGHIDHGKTSLVRILTGVETDRLAEEKRRGISIDLGFAHAKLSSGAALSFVDVPGHENFVRNMVAGISGIAAAMLVVAADEGVKPQTREHLDICKLLGVRTGLVALTKSDLVSTSQIEAAKNEVASLCAGSFLAGRPIIAVSATTGIGIDQLLEALERLAADATERGNPALARLPIDRSFALKGFGTIVTGTLAQGELTVGEAVILHPSGREARIRGLQMAGEQVLHARSGERTGVNLSGIDHAEISRGEVLTHLNQLQPTSIIDVVVDWLDVANHPQRRQQFLLHSGTAEIPVSLKSLGPDCPFSRIWLDRPALLLPDDRFILRKPSPASTVAGGSVLAAFPPLRLNRTKAATRLRVLKQQDWSRRLELLVGESGQGLGLDNLVRLTGLSSQRLRSLIEEAGGLTFIEEAGRAFSTAWLEGRRTGLVEWLSTFHRQYPSLRGAPLAKARMNLEPVAARAVFAGFPAVQLEGDLVFLRDHKPQLSDEHRKLLADIENSFKRGGYQPPPASEVLRSLSIDPAKSRSVLEALIKSNRLVRVTDQLVFHADVVQHIRQSLAAHRGRRFSVPEFKEWTQISRKYAIPLLEYLDRHRITKRDGDLRVVL